ncbi:hypothetical protein PENTCL1PPCAC_18005, partial [Pristionchus entomophagus]
KGHGSNKNETDKRFQHPSQRSNVSSSNVSTRFFCPISDCTKFYATKKLLTQHYVKSHNPKNEECEQCGLRFALKRDRVYHEKKRCRNRPTMNTQMTDKTKNGEKSAVLIRKGATTVILLKADTTESLMERIVSELNRKECNTVDGMSQTDDMPTPSSQPLIADSMSQSIQTLQYPPFHETRHVETSIDTDFDDFRHIETQTLPLFNSEPLDIHRYSWHD